MTNHLSASLRRVRAWLHGWLHRPDPPVTIDLTESSRRQAVRDAEWSMAADAEARVVRTVRSARSMPRKQVTAVVERRRVPRGQEESV